MYTPRRGSSYVVRYGIRITLQSCLYNILSIFCPRSAGHNCTIENSETAHQHPTTDGLVELRESREHLCFPDSKRSQGRTYHKLGTATGEKKKIFKSNQGVDETARRLQLITAPNPSWENLRVSRLGPRTVPLTSRGSTQTPGGN